MDEIRRFIIKLLRRKLRPEDLRATAQRLREEADGLEQRAAALEAAVTMPPRQQHEALKRIANRGGRPGEGVRWDGRQLYIGRLLWYELGSPAYANFHFAGAATEIRAGSGIAGDYRIDVRQNRAPRIACRGAFDIAQWSKGWRKGEIKGNAIVFQNEAERD